MGHFGMFGQGRMGQGLDMVVRKDFVIMVAAV
jgi:hypothetical protein